MATPATELTEAQFQQRVMDLARVLKWTVYHTFDSRNSSSRGFPDLVAVNPDQGRILYVELKAPRGVLTLPQRQWLDKLARCGAEATVWRPADWDEAVAVLRGKRLPIPEPKD